MFRRTLTTAALTAGLVVGTAGMASAHECFVVKRSEKGSAAATASGNWTTLSLAHLLADLPPFLPVLTPEQQAEAHALAVAQGIPASVAVFAPRTIPGPVEHGDPRGGDGKGIDHFFGTYGDQLVGVVLQVSGS